MARTKFKTVPVTELVESGVVQPKEISTPTNGTEAPLVLVVDDERIIADTLAEILRRSGFQAVSEYSGYSALKRVSCIRPEIVLTDVLMPGMNGIDLALAVRERCPECKVILFSGQTGIEEVQRRAGDAGRDFKLLSKPMHPAELLAEIARQGISADKT